LDSTQRVGDVRIVSKNVGALTFGSHVEHFGICAPARTRKYGGPICLTADESKAFRERPYLKLFAQRWRFGLFFGAPSRINNESTHAA